MKCFSCGYELPDDSEFCQYCGKKTPSIIDADSEPESAAKCELSEESSRSIIVNPISFEEDKPSGRNNDVASTAESAPVAPVPEEPIFEEPIPMVPEPEKPISVAPEAHTGEFLQSQPSTPVEKKRKFCKYCGGLIDSATKKCTGCGKQYFNAKFKPLYIILVILVLLGGYIGVNYFCAISAMNNQEFIKSRQFFDNLFISETVFSGKYAYVEAGVLMEEGKYIEALDGFSKIESVPVPVTITDSLKSKIYSAGQTAYKAENMTEAKRNFNALGNYKRSADYLLLISCNSGGFSGWSNAISHYSELVELLEFENAAEIIMTDQSTAILFLTGRWEGDSCYFEIAAGENNTST
ncbi:MAG TPA: zinc ribbon domain-containing protein, partial [Clostridiaceae bacterium]|nr:zinc ribbon domain-containing protein [Clostridiaceae bacterium]